MFLTLTCICRLWICFILAFYWYTSTDVRPSISKFSSSSIFQKMLSLKQQNASVFSRSSLWYITRVYNPLNGKQSISWSDCSWRSSLIMVYTRATEILKSKSVRLTDDAIRTCVRQSQIVTKTNDSSFSSKSVSEIIFLILCSLWIGPKRIWVGKKAKTCLSKFDIKFLVFVYF